MKTRIPFPVLALVLLAQACAGGGSDEAVTGDELGLSKASVFSTPDPIVAGSTAEEPGENQPLGAYFSESPPLISHDISDFVPIRIGENFCLQCHDLHDQIGEEVAQGDPTPMPASHYTDLRRNPDEVTTKVIGARFVCTQCHATQSDTTPLVANTYRQ
jgi:cytochrome c-type protein NapB